MDGELKEGAVARAGRTVACGVESSEEVTGASLVLMVGHSDFPKAGIWVILGF